MKNSSPVYENNSHRITKRIRKASPVVVPLGVWLNDAKEEAFCVLIADGIPLAIAFERAGFEPKSKAASALHLFQSQRIQDRVKAIIAARASHPPISLPEVTDMLKRVYVGAIHDCDYTPAHNAAFSLARLHGLVVDRAQLDVIRRPSREPDAPAEIALADWIQRLPTSPFATEPSRPEPSGLVIEGSAFGSDLDATGMEIRNGAPIGPVTGTPHPGAHSEPMGVGAHSAPSEPMAPMEESGSPSLDEGTSIPNAEDLF